MGADEGTLQVIDVEIIIENFPIHTYDAYVPTSSTCYSIDVVPKIK